MDISSRMTKIAFDRNFTPETGRAVAVAPGVRRVTAPNPGPFTFHGTNSYIVGDRGVAIIDPGPDDAAHVAALLAAVAGRPVTHLLVTHAHRDHAAAAARLQAATGAPRFAPADGAMVEGDGWRLEAVATPGHTADHLAYALDGTDILFSGDHVMAWSTTIVAPPEGNMADYMRSLEKLLARQERLYLPGHGGPVVDVPNYLQDLRNHRLAREAVILDRLRHGDRTIAEMVAAIYADTDPGLHAAAALSVLAHLEDLVVRRRVASDGPPRLEATYRLA
jgi:hydroxyacylglutathione hydrolase